MQTREVKDATPHPTESSLLGRTLERLMALTYRHPDVMQEVVNTMIIGGLALAASAPKLTESLGKQAIIASAGFATSLGAWGAKFVQTVYYGPPIDKNKQVYKPINFKYNTAVAQLVLKEKAMPLLQVKADNHYDAGFAEGYVLAPNMYEALKKMRFLYNFFRRFFGAPEENNLKTYLANILEKVPAYLEQEMHGKVTGYNRWLAQNHPLDKPLAFEFYLLIQCSPDFHNYNPFKKNPLSTPVGGCTTVAMRLNEVTTIVRVRHWPSYNASEYFLQIDRNITGKKRTIDIGHPVVTGGLTILNEDGLFLEINVAQAENDNKIKGMPALLYNRFIADHAKNVLEVKQWVKKISPLSAYHLTVSDGLLTETVHFYQDIKTKDLHTIDKLSDNKSFTQLMIVANHGIKWDKDKSTIQNNNDSDERIENIKAYYERPEVKAQLSSYVDKQKVADLSAEDIFEIKKLALKMVDQPLVSNCESVLCAIVVYKSNKIIDASVAIDNAFAQKQSLENFKSLASLELKSTEMKECKKPIKSSDFISTAASVEEKPKDVAKVTHSHSLFKPAVLVAGGIGAGVGVASGVGPLVGLLWAGASAKAAETVSYLISTRKP